MPSIGIAKNVYEVPTCKLLVEQRRSLEGFSTKRAHISNWFELLQSTIRRRMLALRSTKAASIFQRARTEPGAFHCPSINTADRVAPKPLIGRS